MFIVKGRARSDGTAAASTPEPGSRSRSLNADRCSARPNAKHALRARTTHPGHSQASRAWADIPGGDRGDCAADSWPRSYNATPSGELRPTKGPLEIWCRRRQDIDILSLARRRRRQRTRDVAVRTPERVPWTPRLQRAPWPLPFRDPRDPPRWSSRLHVARARAGRPPRQGAGPADGAEAQPLPEERSHEDAKRSPPGVIEISSTTRPSQRVGAATRNLRTIEGNIGDAPDVLGTAWPRRSASRQLLLDELGDPGGGDEAPRPCDEGNPADRPAVTLQRSQASSHYGRPSRRDGGARAAPPLDRRFHETPRRAVRDRPRPAAAGRRPRGERLSREGYPGTRESGLARLRPACYSSTGQDQVPGRCRPPERPAPPGDHATLGEEKALEAAAMTRARTPPPRGPAGGAAPVACTDLVQRSRVMRQGQPRQGVEAPTRPGPMPAQGRGRCYASPYPGRAKDYRAAPSPRPPRTGVPRYPKARAGDKRGRRAIVPVPGHPRSEARDVKAAPRHLRCPAAAGRSGRYLRSMADGARGEDADSSAPSRPLHDAPRQRDAERSWLPRGGLPQGAGRVPSPPRPATPSRVRVHGRPVSGTPWGEEAIWPSPTPTDGRRDDDAVPTPPALES